MLCSFFFIIGRWLIVEEALHCSSLLSHMVASAAALVLYVARTVAICHKIAFSYIGGVLQDRAILDTKRRRELDLRLQGELGAEKKLNSIDANFHC